MGNRIQFGKTYKAYCRYGDEVLEYDVELAEIRHYRKRNSNETLHYVAFWIKGDKEGLAWLSGLNSRPTSLPTGYLLAEFDDEINLEMITFDKKLCEADL